MLKPHHLLQNNSLIVSEFNFKRPKTESTRSSDYEFGGSCFPPFRDQKSECFLLETTSLSSSCHFKGPRSPEGTGHQEPRISLNQSKG